MDYENLEVVSKEFNIPVYKTDEGHLVNKGREVWEQLHVLKQFTNWMPELLEKIDAVKGTDYEVFNEIVKNPEGGRPQDDYVLKINTTREILLVVGTHGNCAKVTRDKSKEYRKYLLSLEENIKAINSPTASLELLRCASSLTGKFLDWTKAMNMPAHIGMKNLIKTLKPFGFIIPDEMVYAPVRYQQVTIMDLPQIKE